MIEEERGPADDEPRTLDPAAARDPIRTTDPDVIRISTEEEAWAYLQTALDEPGTRDAHLRLVAFTGWPSVSIYLPNTPTDSSISPSMMEALLDLQRTIYRTHTFIASDTGDLRTLSRGEKEQLDFRVRVKGGSSGYDIDLTKIAETFVRDAIGRMSSTDLTITVVAVTLILAGGWAFKTWLTHRAEQRKAELEDDDKKRWLTALQDVLKHDSSRQEMIARAIQRQPILGEIEASAENSRNQIVRAIADDRGGSFLGVEVDADTANEITQQKRQQGTDIRLAGVYRVSKVDTTVVDGFRVTLQDVGTGEEITASLQDAVLSEGQRTLFSRSEWSKKPLMVELTARRLRNRVIDAVVVGAREHTPTSIKPD